MPYAILQFEKRKGGPTSALEKHHERKKKQYTSNSDIDNERSYLNYHFIEPTHKYYGEIQLRIEQAQKENPKCKVRCDSVKFIDTIVTASPEFLAELSSQQTHHYFEHALDFLKEEVGEDNIFSAVVHMNERLSAKDVIGNRDTLIGWQDKFHDHMVLEFSTLERGQSAASTKHKHVPTWLYKQAQRLSQQMTQMQNEIQSIGTFNAQKNKELLLELFDKWYPKVNAFENQLRPYADQLEIMRHNQNVLELQKNRAEMSAQKSEGEAVSLAQQLADYQEFVESIPELLRSELIASFETGQAQADEQEQLHTL